MTNDSSNTPAVSQPAIDPNPTAEEAELISDGQGSAAYKKQLVRVYVARALRAALAQDGGAKH